eukprot:747507-Hanusia_phi.AAC.1
MSSRPDATPSNPTEQEGEKQCKRQRNLHRTCASTPCNPIAMQQAIAPHENKDHKSGNRLLRMRIKLTFCLNRARPKAIQSRRKIKSNHCLSNLVARFLPPDVADIHQHDNPQRACDPVRQLEVATYLELTHLLLSSVPSSTMICEMRINLIVLNVSRSRQHHKQQAFKYSPHTGRIQPWLGETQKGLGALRGRGGDRENDLGVGHISGVPVCL